MDHADRIIKINESLEKIKLTEAVPLIGAVIGGVARFLGPKLMNTQMRLGSMSMGGKPGMEAALRLGVSKGDIRTNQFYAGQQMMAGAGAGQQMPTTSDAQQSKPGEPMTPTDAEGAPSDQPTSIVAPGTPRTSRSNMGVGSY